MKIVATKDGSSTLFSEETGENYHSIHGALGESVHVFIEAGLIPAFDKFNEVRILEIGTGTGLNAALACMYSKKHNNHIYYTATEPFPPDLDLLNAFTLPTEGEFCELHDCFHSINQQRHIGEFSIGSHFSMHYHQKRVQEVLLQENSFELVFSDAFSPSAQPELWSLALYQRIFNALVPRGILCTYVAKGEFRRVLKACGFIVEKLPGFAGKREMTRAIKPDES